jgi:hypothetical protein
MKVVGSTGHNSISEHADYAALLRGPSQPP